MIHHRFLRTVDSSLDSAQKALEFVNGYIK